MLTRRHAAPFLHLRGERLHLNYLADSSGRVVPFLDRLCRLVGHLEGWPRSAVVEALRRQERRVRDSTRLAGLAKALLDSCDFQTPAGAERAEELRSALFLARGQRWPPVPGDRAVPYEDAARTLNIPVSDIERLLYADAPGARLLVRAPSMDGRALLAHYNLELARAVLLDAERLSVTTRGGWRGTFRAIKNARLMYTLERHGRSYRVDITGPAAEFIVRPSRYGARLARVIPAVARAPGWRVRAVVRYAEGKAMFEMHGSPRAEAEDAPVGADPRRTTYDSRWERSLAADFRQRLSERRDGWRLTRETTPIQVGAELFLPDFTLRHDDGREALVELVGFWTPDYLETKARKIAAAGLNNLILVAYRGLAVGESRDALTRAVDDDRIVWFTNKPRAGAVLKAAERWASRP